MRNTIKEKDTLQYFKGRSNQLFEEKQYLLAYFTIIDMDLAICYSGMAECCLEFTKKDIELKKSYSEFTKITKEERIEIISCLQEDSDVAVLI